MSGQELTEEQYRKLNGCESDEDEQVSTKKSKSVKNSNNDGKVEISKDWDTEAHRITDEENNKPKYGND